MAKLDRNKLLGIGIIGGVGILVLVLAMIFLGPLLSGSKTPAQQTISADQTISLSVPGDSAGTAQQYLVSVQKDSFYRRPTDLFLASGESSYPDSVVFQLSMNIHNSGSSTINLRDMNLGSVFSLESNGPAGASVGDGVLNNTDYSSGGDHPVGITTLATPTQVIAGGTVAVTLLYIVPQGNDTFDFTISSSAGGKNTHYVLHIQ
jgi:hypothetical protein